MIFRRRSKDQYEGWWEPVAASPSPRLHGKIEWEPSRNGGTEIDLLVKDLDVPDGQEVDVVCDGDVVVRAAVAGGSVRTTISSSQGYSVPRLAGRAVELHHRGAVLARTVLEPD